MFKKSLVALALASVSAGAMAAADLAGGITKRTVSVEGASSLTNVASDAVTLTLGAEYAVGDVLTFTFSGADLVTGSLPTSINATLVDTSDTMVLGLIDSSATTAIYRVTELTFDGLATESTVGATAAFAAETELLFEAADVIASGSVSMTYSAETSTGLSLDTPDGTDGTGVLLDTVSQFTATVTTPFDATIDVNQDRLAFDDATGTTFDIITITPANASATTEYDATFVGSTFTIYGDWSILDDDADTDGIQLNNAGVLDITNGTLDSVDAEKIVITHNAVAAMSLDVDVSTDSTDAAAVAAAALAEQTFTVDVNVDFTDHGDDADSTNPGSNSAAGDSDLLTGSAGGAWDLNGSVVEVPYLPFGPVTQPILRHTNTSTQTGDISVRYMVEGEHTAWQDLGVLVEDAEPGVRNLLSEVTTALAGAGYDASASGFKVALEITTNVPDGKVTITAAAKFTTTDSDRLTVGTFN